MSARTAQAWPIASKASSPTVRHCWGCGKGSLPISPSVDGGSFPLIPQRIVHDVRLMIPADGIVALDNGMYKIWFARNYRTTVANTLLLDNALATMGAGLPSAIAASLIYPDYRVLAVCGDGGFMMNTQELETAARLKLNLVVLVIEDPAYGMIRWKQEVDRFPDFGLEFGNPDFVAYAKSYGAKGSRGGNASDFPTMLELLWPKAACISLSCRSTTARTCACWSASCTR